MSDSENTGERFMRFHAMYREVLDKEFDALEFADGQGPALLGVTLDLSQPPGRRVC